MPWTLNSFFNVYKGQHLIFQHDNSWRERVHLEQGERKAVLHTRAIIYRLNCQGLILEDIGKGLTPPHLDGSHSN